MNIRESKAITIISLVVTIIILLIISGISITGVIRGIDETQEATQISQLNMIQHTILERKTKAQYTKEELPGTELHETELKNIINQINQKATESITIKGETQDYKKLSTTDLEDLGVSGDTDTYIVNYKTGEVINITKMTTKKGKALYIYSK